MSKTEATKDLCLELKRISGRALKAKQENNMVELIECKEQCRIVKEILAKIVQ